MASLAAEDFDTGPAGAALSTDTTGATAVYGATPPRFATDAKQGTFCASFATDGTAAGYAVWAWPDTPLIWAGLFVRLNATPVGNYTIAWWGNAGVRVGDLRVTVDRTLVLRNELQQLAVSPPLPIGQWAWVVVRSKPGDPAGHTIRLWLPSDLGSATPTFTATGSAVNSAGVTAVGQFRIGDNNPATVTAFNADRLRIDNSIEPQQSGGADQDLLFAEHFDGGFTTTAGDSVSTSNTLLTATAGVPMVFATGAREGAFCARGVIDATQTSTVTKDHSSQSHIWYVWNYKPAVQPPATVTIAKWFNVVGGVATQVGDLRHNPDGTLSLRDGANTVLTSTAAVSTSLWNRIAIQVDAGTAAGHALKMYVQDTAAPVYSGTAPATQAMQTGVTRLRLGVPTAGVAHDFRIDYLRASVTTEPGGVAVTEVFAEDFTAVPDGAPITTSNTAFTSVTGSGAAAATGTTDAYDGVRAARLVMSGTSVQMRKDFTGQPASWHAFYCKVAAYPSASVGLAQWYAGLTKIGDIRILTDGTLELRDGSNGFAVSTVKVTPGEWFRIAVQIIPGNTTSGHRARIYLGPNAATRTADAELVGPATATGVLDSIRWGVASSVNLDATFDRLRVDTVEPLPASGNTNSAVPVANAGPDQTADAFTTVTLTGTATPVAPATIASRSWRVVSSSSGASALTLSSTNADVVTFEAPAGLADRTYTLGYKATDTAGKTSLEDTVVVTVLAATTLRAKAGAWTPVNVRTARSLTWDGSVNPPPTGPTARLTLTRVDLDSVTADWSGSTPGAAAITSAVLDWSDGTPVTLAWPATKTAVHNYPPTPVGPRTVTVTVTDANGLTSTATGQFTVQSATGPQVVLVLTRVDPNTVSAALTITPGSNAVATKTITWGDGATTTLTGTATTATHDYPATPLGLRTVTATVVDTANVTDSDTKTFDVQDTQPPTGGVVLYAAGDIAAPGPKLTDDKVADLIVGRADFDAVLALGDLQYPDGLLADFNTYYDKSWGRFKTKTWPAPGNHEYDNPGTQAPGYSDYFGAAIATPLGPGKYYYVKDVGNWRVIALDSELLAGQDGVTQAMYDAQLTWLQARLAEVAGTSKGVLAYWHRPRYGSSDIHGTTPQSDLPGQFTNRLVDGHADIVLTGHDHLYERFDQMGKTGNVLAGGVRHFTIGTGGCGGSGYTTSVIEPGSQKIIGSDHYGALRLELRATDYAWQYLPVAGDTGTDSGTTPINRK